MALTHHFQRDRLAVAPGIRRQSRCLATTKTNRPTKPEVRKSTISRPGMEAQDHGFGSIGLDGLQATNRGSRPCATKLPSITDPTRVFPEPQPSCPEIYPHGYGRVDHRSVLGCRPDIRIGELPDEAGVDDVWYAGLTLRRRTAPQLTACANRSSAAPYGAATLSRSELQVRMCAGV